MKDISQGTFTHRDPAQAAEGRTSIWPCLVLLGVLCYLAFCQSLWLQIKMLSKPLGFALKKTEKVPALTRYREKFTKLTKVHP